MTEIFLNSYPHSQNKTKQKTLHVERGDFLGKIYKYNIKVYHTMYSKLGEIDAKSDLFKSWSLQSYPTTIIL